MNIAYIGSCLSGQIVKSLLQQDPGHDLIAGLPHMRLDCLHELWVKKNNLFPGKDILADMLQHLEDMGQLHRNRVRTLHQAKEFLAAFHSHLKKIDWLIIDNNYDLSSKLWEIKYQKTPYRMVNLQIKEALADYEDLGFANLDIAAETYQELFDYFLSINSHLKIVLIQYPINGFVMQGNSKFRIDRALYSAKKLSRTERVINIPLVDIDSGNLSDNGPHYFSDHIYNLYGKLITRLANGDECPLLSQDSIHIAELDKWLNSTKKAEIRPSARGSNPYDVLPARNFWKPAVGERYPLAIEGLYDKKFPINTKHKIATFGSCFAQHIGHRLKASGFNYQDLESAPADMPAHERANHGYGIYSARYGNVYTSLQMLQLFQQAFGEQSFAEEWQSNGRYFDPFRPNIFPAGFATAEELHLERSRHLAIVRQLFENLDVLIFTMGLTECWINRKTGAAYPTAPGITVGTFDPDIYEFRNLGFTEIKQQMQDMIGRLRSVNPQARILLTVSPVPLTATYENRHVLISTMHSKSILRAVAGELADELSYVDYFPSYEIIVSSPYRSMFFKNNLRNIHDEGVDYVMTHFFRQHQIESASGELKNSSDNALTEDFCDEVFLELSKKMVS